jgi:cell wall-associated NlpC family hydrolase
MPARISPAIPAGRSRAGRGAALLLLAAWLPACAGAPLRAPDAALAERVTDRARALVGTPYRYGGDTPRGFDCSGFVRYVYRKAADLTLPHSARRLFTTGRPVSRGQELPSDLIFYNTGGGGPTHVGIYLGKGWFIHASDSGDTVKVADGSDSYWRARYLGARRVLP